jgi:hypothetical protein
MIYTRGEARWNVIDGVKLLISPPELSGNPTVCHLVANKEELGKEIIDFLPYEVSLSYFEGFFNMP